VNGQVHDPIVFILGNIAPSVLAHCVVAVRTDTSNKAMKNLSKIAQSVLDNLPAQPSRTPLSMVSPATTYAGEPEYVGLDLATYYLD
jgi:hypothetical protein